MRKLTLHVKNIVSVLLASFIFLSTLLPAISHAQSVSFDYEAPTITHELISEGDRGAEQIFQADVTDNIAVAKVTLYYRFNESEEYKTLSMSNTSNGYTYISRIETSEDTESPIYYYIEAQDDAENITLKGYSFDPLKRWLDPASERAKQKDSKEIDSNKSNTLYYILGGVALLAVVGGLSAGGSGDGDQGNISTQTQKLTLEITAPGN